ncbi:MAG TPA: 50S ribosomal protein L10 [Candidatus Paceibacterota bacterium]|nr:50S ribosomal protein L10 [Candidatus Paceibacterota bacterium]
MAKTKEQKQEIVTKLENAIKSSASSVFVHFSQMNVADESAMRRELRGEGIGYTVAKKTLMRRALDTLGYKSADLPMDGEIAVAYGGGNDATAVARRMHEFGKKLPGKLMIMGGVFDGALKGQADMQEIATIPPVQTLRGMFVNVINSPIAGLAVALKAIGDKQGTNA